MQSLIHTQPVIESDVTEAFLDIIRASKTKRQNLFNFNMRWWYRMAKVRSVPRLHSFTSFEGTRTTFLQILGVSHNMIILKSARLPVVEVASFHEREALDAHE
jgi:hypothetical protein